MFTAFFVRTPNAGAFRRQDPPAFSAGVYPGRAPPCFEAGGLIQYVLTTLNDRRQRRGISTGKYDKQGPKSIYNTLNECCIPH